MASFFGMGLFSLVKNKYLNILYFVNFLKIAANN